MTRSAVERQRGAAILAAMLTVVLVATLASAVLWQQWRGVEVEAAERSRTQSAWVLTGALDWARLILREDARKGGTDHLAEPWAVPLEQARLSTFLAADRSDALAADESQEAFLAGQITDLQSRLNVANLVKDGKVYEPSRIAFARLFEVLGLPASELTTLAENLRLALETNVESNPSAPTSVGPTNDDAPLLPQDLDQLAWLGLSVRAVAVLRPFVTVLPVHTPVNLNTAPVEVVYACVEALAMADAHRLVQSRDAAPLTSLNNAAKATGNATVLLNETQHSVATRFFEVRGQLQVNQTTVQEFSVVQREGQDVKVLWRRRGATRLPAPLQ